MERDLDSSMIKHVAYDEDTQRMTLTMGERDYDFDGVPADVVNELCDCESAGRYYAENIKGRYPRQES